MSEKLGNGGNGPEQYDPATGRYIGDSSVISKISKGRYGQKIKQVFDSLSAADKNNFVQDFSDYINQHKQTIPSISNLKQTEIETFKSQNPNLHPGEVDLAAKTIQEYEKIEPKITQNLVDLATDFGGMLVGLDHRVKTLPSTIARMEKNGGGKGSDFDNEKALYGVKDILRYTACFDDAKFDKVVPQMANAMQEDYQLVRVLNGMTQGSLYKGINCLFTDGKGHVFEMQFHTPDSIKVKEGMIVDLANKTATRDASLPTSHGLYETIRDVKTRAKNGTASAQEIADSKALNSELYNMWNKVQNHPNVRILRTNVNSNFKKCTK